MHSSNRHTQALLIALLQEQPHVMRFLLENMVELSSETPEAGGWISPGRIGVLFQEARWIAYDFVMFPDPHAPKRWAAACMSLLASRRSSGTLVLFVNTTQMKTWVQAQTIAAGCTQFHPTVVNLGTHSALLLFRRNTTLQLLGLWAQQPRESHDTLRQAIQLLNVAARRSLEDGLHIAEALFLLLPEPLKTLLFQDIMTMYKQTRTARLPYRSPHLRNMLHLLRDQTSQSARVALARKWIFHVVRNRHIRLSRSLRLAIEHSDDIEALEELFLSLLPHQQKADLYNALRRFRWGQH